MADKGGNIQAVANVVRSWKCKENHQKNNSAEESELPAQT